MRPTLALIIICLLAASLGTPPTLAGPLTENGTQPVLTYPLRKADQCTHCHADYDQTGLVAVVDVGFFLPCFGKATAVCVEADHTEPVTGPPGVTDIGVLLPLFGKAPGPSGTSAGTLACPNL